MSRSFTANGNIKPYRFVRQDVTADFKVLQATDGAAAHGTLNIGVSQPATHLPPYSTLDDGYAAVAGLELLVWEEGDECLLVAGSGGVTAGDNLKSDSDGKAITAAAGDNVGARALNTVPAGGLIRALVTVGRLMI